MCNLIKYSDPYSMKSGCLWKYYRDEPGLDSNGNIIDCFNDNNNCASFKFKQKITGKTGNGGTQDVEIMVPLKHLSNFWRTLEMPFINFEISLQLKWCRNCIIVAGATNNQNPTFQINNTKLYVSAVTSSAQENIKNCFKKNLVLKEQLIGINI